MVSDRNLTAELLLGAYATGVFPMAESRDDPDIHWVDPRVRGVLPLDGFHMSRSLARRMRSGNYTATLDVEFEAIVDGCANREETWINGTIRELVIELHAMGHAHGFGVWSKGRLVGGMYGVALGGAFFGESMFSAATDGSKMSLAWAVDHLRRTGFVLYDTQFSSPHLASLGVAEVTRAVYRAALARALEASADITRVPLETDPQAVVQRITQTSYRG
ncbi:MAG: leucyl/phenylalanyl-tRNA--protein transferase [Boseongicola sp.]|nr:leucyl/phenylalanyl-tRNA--protein transferase [Boseongicola sp.]MYH57335.1 leucyl/phenylalanyl-tRNA--protein transferase [Boseongicola sp. SB0675_bin_26]